jgi:hypothetical protein
MRSDQNLEKTQLLAGIPPSWGQNPNFQLKFGFRNGGRLAENLYEKAVLKISAEKQRWPDILLTFASRFGIRTMAG